MKRYIYLKVNHSASKIAEACLFLTPQVSLFQDSILILEIASTQKFFGGETGVLTQLERILSEFLKEEEKNWVVLENPAWGGCFLNSRNLILPLKESHSYLMKLSLNQLVFCGSPEEVFLEQKQREQLVAFMYRIGMKTFSDFSKLSPLAVSRRFGKMGVSLMEWVKGEKELLLPVFNSIEKLEETIPGEKLYSLESLLFVLKNILSRWELRMRGRNMGAQSLKFKFSLESGNFFEKKVSFSQAFQEANKILKILGEFLSPLTWEAPISKLQVAIEETQSYKPAQLSLWNSLENRYEDLQEFLMRFQNRYPKAVIGFPHLSENYLPEKSWLISPLPSKKENNRDQLISRPLFIFSKPTPYSIGREVELVASEEVVTDWWEENLSTRRYFIAKEKSKELLWVYFDSREKKWFLHGAFN